MDRPRCFRQSRCSRRRTRRGPREGTCPARQVESIGNCGRLAASDRLVAMGAVWGEKAGRWHGKLRVTLAGSLPAYAPSPYPRRPWIVARRSLALPRGQERVDVHVRHFLRLVGSGRLAVREAAIQVVHQTFHVRWRPRCRGVPEATVTENLLDHLAPTLPPGEAGDRLLCGEVAGGGVLQNFEDGLPGRTSATAQRGTVPTLLDDVQDHRLARPVCDDAGPRDSGLALRRPVLRGGVEVGLDDLLESAAAPEGTAAEDISALDRPIGRLQGTQGRWPSRPQDHVGGHPSDDRFRSGLADFWA